MSVIQIFGKSKCFDTKKAERYFKERRIPVQRIDLPRFGMSGGEFDSVLRAVGGVDNLINWELKSPEIDLLRYTGDRTVKEDKLFDHPELRKQHESAYCQNDAIRAIRTGLHCRACLGDV